MIFRWFGMHTKIKSSNRRQKVLRDIRSSVLIVLFVIVVGASPLFSVSLISAEIPMYIPSVPSGTTFGYVGLEYEYVITTMNPDSLWMFDWGDGTNSSWLQLEDGQTTITQTHRWNAPGMYQLHVRFKSETVPHGIWSDALMIEITAFSDEDFPNKPILRTGKIQGISGYEYTYSALTTDPHGSQVCYRFDYNNEILSEWTPYVPSGTVSYIPFVWDKAGEYSIRVQAKNQYGLESLWSDSVHVTMKNASEDTGASVDLLVLNDITYHIIFTSNVSGTFYNSSAGISSDVLWTSGGMFLIDEESDGRWEYIYAPAIGEIQPYQETIASEENFLSGIPLLLIFIIITIIVVVIGVIVVLVRTGYIYLYEEEVVVEK